MPKLTIKDVDLAGKMVLMRADFNVPQDASLKITDDTRIRATLPTILYILDKKVKKLVLMSHLGRPDGKKQEKYSLRPVAVRLQELLKKKVKFIEDCIGENKEKEIASSTEDIILLENLRFYPQEEANDPVFARDLSAGFDLFVNDAFGTAHRAHASTEGVTHYLKSVAGFLLEKEIQYLGNTVSSPSRPFMVILGGAKVSDKIGMIENLLPKCDAILIGGGMSYTFLKAQGKSIGNSKLEKDKVELARGLLEKSAKLKKDILLPVDHVVVDSVSEDAEAQILHGDIPDGKIAVDIGPETISNFEAKLKSAKTIVWNGPVGIFEMDKFSRGTQELAKFIGDLGVTTIIGGGDTAAAIAKFRLEEKMTHISTGGGASLEFLEGKVLPGIAALTDK